jgi:hypothetical protein
MFTCIVLLDATRTVDVSLYDGVRMVYNGVVWCGVVREERLRLCIGSCVSLDLHITARN